MVARRYGKTPSDYIFDKRPDAYLRYQIDSAAALRAILRENQPYREAERERKQRAEDERLGVPEVARREVKNEMALGPNGRLLGSLGGEVGEFAPDALRTMEKLGVPLPPKAERTSFLDQYLKDRAHSQGSTVVIAGETYSPDGDGNNGSQNGSN